MIRNAYRPKTCRFKPGDGIDPTKVVNAIYPEAKYGK
jgi:hypothetical protein